MIGGEITLKQKAIFSVVAVVALYIACIGLWFLRQEKEWKKAARRYEEAKTTYQKECALVKEKAQWQAHYDSEASQIPAISVGQGADTVWLRITDNIAASNHVFISTSSQSPEADAGDNMRKISITAKWDAALESLVNYLYELENSSEGKFDVEQLTLLPNNKKRGYLGGNISITCVYNRNGEE